MKILNLREEKDLQKWGIKRTSSTKQIVLGDETKEYDVYLIPIEILQYNLNNGRMYMEVKKFESDQDIKLEDLAKENVEKYNDEIENLIWSTNEDKNAATKKDIEKYGQLEAGVVLDDGTVIDGNRRFTCLRKLHREKCDDERFKYFKAALVFVDGQEITKEILKKYELKVQFGADEKVTYNTINMYMSIYDLVVKSKTFDISTIASLVNKKTSEIIKIINTCKLVDEFLAYIGKKDAYMIAEKYNVYWPLETLQAYISKNEKNLTSIELSNRKNIFFDYLLTLNIELMTQSLRDGLIKKIFNNKDETEKLIEKHQEIIGQDIQKVIEESETTEDFIETIHTLKTSDKSKEDEELYRDVINRLSSSNSIDIPIKECKKALESLNNVNIQPLVKSNNVIAKNKLKEIEEKIDQIIEAANNIKMVIKNNEKGSD